MKHIKFRIYFKLIIMEVLVIFLMRFLIPLLSDYPPYSEDIGFQLKIEALSHDKQYLILGFVAIAMQVIFSSFFFRNIFKYLKKKRKDVSIQETIRVRNDCFGIPKKLFIIQSILLCCVLFMLFSMVKISFVLCIKFLLIYFSFFTASWVISMVLIKGDLDKIVDSTYAINTNVTMPKHKTRFYLTLIRNLIPFFIFIMITMSLLGYSKVTDQIGESKYNYYKQAVGNIDFSNLTVYEIKNKLNSVTLREPDDYYFIICDDNKYFSRSDGNVTNFFLQYANDFIEQTDGRVYEYYGVEEQAYAKKIQISKDKYILIGFKFSSMSMSTIYFYLITALLSTVAYVSVLSVWTKNISKSIENVAKDMAEIANRANIEQNYILPVFSNDEIGDLTVSFNKIQELAINDIKEIKSNQETLMEKERLATLGQMIGGVAHNLKTPIMSISGATEGLEDLVKEYDESIGDPDVTVDDHHAIAHDMSEWITKIRSYDAYMSDIITAVKGQAVSMNDKTTDTFTIDEMLTRVNILMKHELKEALVTMNIDLQIPKDTKLTGNVNSLVQVVNNLISNSIQAYVKIEKEKTVVDIKSNVSDTRTSNDFINYGNSSSSSLIGKVSSGVANEKTIDLIICEKGDNIIISVSDHGCGMPDEVQKKLFKEMITTKGHNGSGLGMFMSYSTIKGNFKGDITFTSEVGKGTTFNVILPRK